MKVTVTTDSSTCELEIAEDLELENFKVLCEVELGLPAAECIVMLNTLPLADDKKPLKDFGVQNGDLLFLMRKRPANAQTSPQAGLLGNIPIDFGSIQVPNARRAEETSATTSRSSSQGHTSSDFDNKSDKSPQSEDSKNLGDIPDGEDDPAVVRDMLLANPEQKTLLRHHNPELADALDSENLEKFSQVLKSQQDARKERQRQRVRLLAADPFDMDAQKLIAEQIQQQNIDANMEAAMEFNPECFGTVIMLYIDCKVNGHHVKAFIDSGAQTTIMSESCAERCNIMRLVDRRWAGTAHGVGTQKILGRVHMGQIQIEGDFLASSFCILGAQTMDMLLGLDMLKRHQMVIDLKNGELIIGTTNTRTKFLPENELPDGAFPKKVESTKMESDDDQLQRTLEESMKSPSTSRPVAAVSYPDADIAEIMQIGVTRDQAIEELRKQNGNKVQAMAAIFAKSFTK